MKKVVAVLLSFILILPLCGCSFKVNSLEKGLEALVSAIGFNQQGDVFSIYIETVTVNSESSEADKKLTRTEGNGKNLADAYNDACRKTVRPFMFSHCAVAILGDGITAKRTREICRFLYNKDEINLALRFLYTDSPKELLSCETVASVAVGYDLVDALDRQSDYSGTIFKNRFYEVEAVRKKAINIFTLPEFTVKNKAYEKTGSVIFRNDEPIMWLDEEETFIYSIAAGTQRNGTVLLNGKEYSIKKLETEHKFSMDKRLQTKLDINIELKGDGRPKSDIAASVSELFINSKLKGADIFLFGEIIEKKEAKIWKQIEHDYYTIYKNSQLAVTVK